MQSAEKTLPNHDFWYQDSRFTTSNTTVSHRIKKRIAEIKKLK